MSHAACVGWTVDEVRAAFLAGAYVVLGLADMTCTSIALMVGVGEMNPLLAWLAERGAFEPAKIALTVFAASLIALLCRRGQAHPVAWSAVLLMAGVAGYHAWGLSSL